MKNQGITKIDLFVIKTSVLESWLNSSEYRQPDDALVQLINSKIKKKKSDNFFNQYVLLLFMLSLNEPHSSAE